jgi:hypothetical protein
LFCGFENELMESSDMQRFVMPLAATLIGAAFVAASPLPASASAKDHVKERHAGRQRLKGASASVHREPDHSQIDGRSQEINGTKDDKGHPRDG